MFNTHMPGPAELLLGESPLSRMIVEHCAETLGKKFRRQFAVAVDVSRFPDNGGTFTDVIQHLERLGWSVTPLRTGRVLTWVFTNSADSMVTFAGEDAHLVSAMVELGWELEARDADSFKLERPDACRRRDREVLFKHWGQSRNAMSA